MNLARKFDLLVIEDAAEAHGAVYYSGDDKKNGRCAGAIGDAGCFSFYANKIITTGEGGMVVTDDDRIAARARSLKDLAHSPTKRFWHTDIAFNYRMTNLQAAVGVAQMEEIDRFIRIKRWMAETYRAQLGEVRGLNLPVEKSWARSVYWMYAVLVEDDFGIDRDRLMDTLRERGVDTRSFFVPVHQQPVFQGSDICKSLSLPVSEELSRKGLYLPSGLALTETQILDTCKIVKTIAEEIV
jgi:perosamine synthetase